MFEAAVAHIKALQGQGRKVIVAGWSDGSRERLSHVLAEHGLKQFELVSSLAQVKTARAGALPLAVIAIEHGFESPDLAVIGEQDILGDRLVRQSKRKRRAQDVLQEASALAAGDLVVHIDHGVGRFIGLKTIEAAGAPHDCLELHYAGGDRLFLPVENLELLSRYGSESGELDKLGGAGWQTRKARLKKRVREMAGELVRIAAAAPDPRGAAARRARRALRRILRALSLRRDAGSGAGDRGDARRSRRRPADGPADLRRRRLRQDGGRAARGVRRRDQRQADRGGRADDVAGAPAFKNFQQRFAGLPVRIGQLSRMVGGGRAARDQEGARRGRRRHRRRHPCRARQDRRSSRISASSSSTRSSISASATRSG